MNYFRKRLLFSFLVLFLTLPVFYFLSALPNTNKYGIGLFFLSVFIMILCLAYILWFYFSLGKRYSEDFDRLILDPNAIAKSGWAIPEREWSAYTRQLLEDFNSEAATTAARDFKSCGYWIINLAFAPIVLLSLLAAYWGYWGALWMVPVPLFFMWVANINTLRFVSPIHNRRQIRRWQKQAGGRFVFGEYGFILGEDYFPLLGSVFWYHQAGVLEKENGNIFLQIESLKKLQRGGIANHRAYQIPVPQEHVEKARGLANFITLQGRILTLRLNSRNASLPARDKTDKAAYATVPVHGDSLKAWLGRDLNDKEIQNFFAERKNVFGSVKHSTNTYYIFSADGIEFMFDEKNRLDSINLNSVFLGKNPLPEALPASMLRPAVIDRLGQPYVSGGGNLFMDKPVPYWDKWVFPGYALHIQYTEKNNMQLITLMNPPEQIDQ